MDKRLFTLMVALMLFGVTLAQDGGVGTLPHNGVDRTYLLHLPPDAEPPLPLVIALHGGSSTADRLQRSMGLDALADREGFAVVYPQGVDDSWNDGRDPSLRSVNAEVDDVGFLVALVDQLADVVMIDTERVYLTGISNGGIMALRVACERPEVVAAVGVFAASLPEGYACAPGQPVPVMLVNGTNDPLLNYDGGFIGNRFQGLGRTVPVTDALAQWAAVNGCGDPLEVALPDNDPDDNTTITRTEYRDCDATTMLFTVDGGGHTIPGGSQYLPRAVIGRVSNDMDGVGTLWDFFAAQTGDAAQAGS